MKNLSISNYKINEDSKPFIIAEISSNHNWSLKHTLRLIKKIKDAGADAVKIQTYDENRMTYESKKSDFLDQKSEIINFLTKKVNRNVMRAISF